ncbi:hypothetical protein ACIRN4_08390 [Pimelobacter simplex]|jgi:mercuric ion transport protein|uniref:Mercuric ion transport protein n=1 Tax=Nocardioides humi TaxID=449461 RepID=A0ABN2AJ85_9ACTN|nr:hypothetical protein [Nocardioides humi]
MSNNNRHEPPDRTDGSGPSGVLLGSGAALFMVVCCAGPALIAAGALGVIGGWLGSPWLIGAALTVLAAAVLWTMTRRRNGSDAADCCNPPQLSHTDLPESTREDH